MSNKRNLETDPDQIMIYQIKLDGHLSCQWIAWFGGMTISLKDNGETFLTGPVVDQADAGAVDLGVRESGRLSAVRPG